jgi:hypothetical protein
MNINKFVFMAWFCNANDAMLEHFDAYVATEHEICRRGKNWRTVLFFYLKDK